MRIRAGGGGLRRPDECGQVSVLIVGFAAVLLLLVAVVVDVSAAHLHRQALDNLAEGAALHGADGGVTGVDELGEHSRLAIDVVTARAAVEDYLVAVGAARDYPGLKHQVEVSGEGRLLVTVRAPVELPIPVPGEPVHTMVGTSAGAGVTIVP